MLFRSKPRLLRRLALVLQAELGHDLAFAVEAGKIASNGGEGSVIDMGRIEAGLTVPISAGSVDRALARFRAPLTQAAAQVCAAAGIREDDVAAVVLVGGSSLMRVVSDDARTQFPRATLYSHDPFTAVVDGLALATRDAVIA